MIKRTTWIRVILAILVVLSCIAYNQPIAEGFELIDMRDVTLTYHNFFPGGVDPLLTQNNLQLGHSMDKEINIGINMDIAKYLYWDNTVHSMTDLGPSGTRGQFRMIGWEFGFGVDVRRIYSKLPVSFGYYHYSRHLLDTDSSLGHFPVEDAFEIKLYLYQRKR